MSSLASDRSTAKAANVQWQKATSKSDLAASKKDAQLDVYHEDSTSPTSSGLPQVRYVLCGRADVAS